MVCIDVNNKMINLRSYIWDKVSCACLCTLSIARVCFNKDPLVDVGSPTHPLTPRLFN